MAVKKQEGTRLSYTNSTSTAISAGDVVAVGDRIGIALVDIAVDASGQLEMEGVFTLAKTTGQAWVVGMQLYWNATTAKVTSTAGSNKSAGVAAAIAASDAATGDVKINA